jgi:DNA adenine methylase
MDYSKKSRQELLDACKAAGLKGYSTKKKDDLIALLKETPTVPVVLTVTTPIIRPFLKWVGGKSQIIDQVMELFPREIVNYHEPFVGGGSVLLALLSLVRKDAISLSGKIYASDLNANLINLYKCIQTHPHELIDEVNKIVAEFSRVTVDGVVNRAPKILEDALTSPESYYYWIRSRFNALSTSDKTTVGAAAMLLFMNKTCFRGVYREGPRGFNVPYGNYTNPGILDEDHIHTVSAAIRDVVFTVAPFTDSLARVEPCDFVYLDPPYAPETGTSFVGYTADGFGADNHQALFRMCGELNERGVKIVMSNADVTLVKDAFPSPTYQTKIILCRRAINSKKPDAKTNEVLIRN